MIDILKLMKRLMLELQLNYEFLELNSDLVFPYVIGEIENIESINEDGKNTYQFILTLTDNNSSILNLLEIEELIKNKFKFGYIENGIVINYINSIIIPQETEDLKRMQINLRINKWEN